MAKRKRAAKAETSRKRAKVPKNHAHGEIDPDKEYKLKSIVDEDRHNYLISWESDEETGEKYAPTWEPKQNANQEAIEDWERQKADKQRPKKPSGKGHTTTTSSGIPSTQQPSSLPKAAFPRRERGLRRVPDSSPSTEEATTANGGHDSDQAQTDEVLEIGESQPSSPLPEEGDRSPLFEPESCSIRRTSKEPTVRPSPPPSSFGAGDYLAVSSSQPPLSDEPAAVRKSLEPSQFLPDPGETSNTTGDTTEVSATVLTSSAESDSLQLESDSLGARGSSSYRPSATQPRPASSSAAEPEEASARPDSSDRQSTGEVGTANCAQPSPLEIVSGPNVQESSGKGAAEVSQPSESALVTKEAPLPLVERTRIDKEYNNSPQSVARTDRAFPASHRASASPTSNGTTSHQANGKHTALDSLYQHEGPPRIATPLSQAASRVNEGGAQTPPRSKLGISEPAAAPPDNRELAAAIAAVPELQPDTGRSQESEHTSAKSSHSESNSLADTIAERAPADSEAPQPPKPISIAASTARSTTSSSIVVTPPPRADLPPFGGTHISPRPLDSSAWFPFQTQLSRPHTASEPIRGFRADSQSQVRPLSEQSPAALFSSSIPLPPSQEVSSRNSERAPPPVQNTLSSPIRLTSSKAMDDTQASKGSQDLLEQIRAMKRQHRTGRSSQRSGTPSTASPHETPKRVPARAPAQHTAVVQSASSVAPGNASVMPNVSSESPVSNAATLASPVLFSRGTDRAHSPAAFPAAEPLPVITREEMNTSRRIETLLPPSQGARPIAETETDGESNGLRTSISQNGAEQSAADRTSEKAETHAIPIYLSARQRNHYQEILYYHKQLVQRVLASNSTSADLVAEAKVLLDRLRHVLMHPDLDNAETETETFTQYDVEPSAKVNWDIGYSAKFRFLKQLMEASKDANLHVAILVSKGRAMDLLETFLRNLQVPCTRTSSQKTSQQTALRDQLAVSLLNVAPDEKALEPADLIIAMDNTANSNSEQVRSLRHDINEKVSLFVSLVVASSVEHVERCLSTTLSERARTRALVSGASKFCDDVGRLPRGQDISNTLAQNLASYVASGGTEEWSLPTLAQLDNLDSQTDSEVDITIISDANTTPRLAVVGEKRSRAMDDEDGDPAESNKRSRVQSPEFPSTVNPQDIDVTHISDSIGKPTQTHHSNEEGSSPELNTIEQRLQKLLMETQDRLDEQVKVMGDLQYRFEEQRRKLFEVTAERDTAMGTAQNAATRFTEETTKTSSLRVENNALKEHLKEANAKLLDHAVPERAEFEALRLETKYDKREKEKLEKRLEQANKDVAYVRDLYQNSSTQAQQSAQQLTELENQLAVMQNKATGEQAKLRKMGHDALTKNLQDENKRMKLMLKEREAGLKFRDEEIAKLKEASRGRMGTRGTSVPRSPRMGSPMVGSRGTSPATGELRGRSSLLHPLRNA